ncbi:MAG: SufE family protein [Planctomycetota bacterium]
MTIDQTQRRIIDEFADLDDWFDKYEHLIGLAKQHEPLAEQFRTDETALPGCQSQVWVRAEVHDGQLRFDAASDSMIITGVLALLLRTLNGHPPKEVADAELYFLEEIGLTANLSPSRANGVATIVRHLQRTAADLGRQLSASCG